jgi:hypothetical protein
MVKDAISDGLKILAKTADNDGYAFSKLTMAEKELRNLHKYLKYYPHLKYVDIS